MAYEYLESRLRVSTNVIEGDMPAAVTVPAGRESSRRHSSRGRPGFFPGRAKQRQPATVARSKDDRIMIFCSIYTAEQRKRVTNVSSRYGVHASRTPARTHTSSSSRARRARLRQIRHLFWQAGHCTRWPGYNIRINIAGNLTPCRSARRSRYSVSLSEPCRRRAGPTVQVQSPVPEWPQSRASDCTVRLRVLKS
jgi:hypothetical protein